MSEPVSQPPVPRPPQVRRVTFADLRAVWSGGWADFRAAPLKGMFFGAVYALGGLALAAWAGTNQAGWVIYPALLGFALIGPFVAVGLYEISRRLERGERPSWGGVLGAVWAQRGTEIGWMGGVMLFALVIWMYQIRLLLALFLGLASYQGFGAFLLEIVTTEEGLWFLLFGHIVGAALALSVFSITVVSIPLLLDRPVDFVTAMITSVKAVQKSPGPMIAWGAFVVGLLILSALPAFLGLLVTLPVLGHATWRLYRVAVAPA